jgi:hypothetical protein
MLFRLKNETSFYLHLLLFDEHLKKVLRMFYAKAFIQKQLQHYLSVLELKKGKENHKFLGIPQGQFLH